ncbi:uncharacterized protein LOC121709989 isoform X4 [Alosa sapidissima]|uniref:uncharacterized protein LOC121709989 isoform X4 n=1 Tax=Alosa sapidissima TaxID=34773 RepID=UPI001C097AD7|nr:uncharacterized protein LOC121709989 isoform X4 [Alosa sapidissima]
MELMPLTGAGNTHWTSSSLNCCRDNLGAHSIGGFVESFSSTHVCRFCLGEKSQFQVSEVRTGAFCPRTIQEHKVHIQTAQGNTNQSHCCGVKRQCPLTEKLKHFDVLCGYPPDLLHDLFEGIVPLELALCLNAFIKERYFTFNELNQLIKEFPYRWADKTDAPQPVPLSYATRKSVGGNAHENWALLRLLPLIVGERIPESDPKWLVLLNLKDIVELVIASVHTDSTICYLDSKISEHRHRFLAAFPQQTLIPKHHFLEHYPQLIKAFGPLVSLWTMRFEAKHSFFKRVVRHTHSFRNILLSLAVKHQLMLAYHLHSSKIVQSSLQVTKLSTVNLTVLREDLKKALETKLPDAPMSQLPKLRIILQDHDIRKLDLPHGIPGTVAELESIVKETFELNGNFTLHYKDAGFGDEYFSLTSTSELQDKDTIKVIHVVEPPTYTLTFTDLDSTIENETSIHTSDHPSVTSISPNSSCSTGSADTVILSSPEHTTRRSQCWPTEFPIPRFAYDTELVLASRNEAFKKDGIYLVFTSILQDILEKVAETVFQYVAYPTNAQLSDVALALVQKHPSLKEPGSYNGCYGWLQRLKYKMGNYRSKLRGLGCPEVDVNSIRKKRAHDRAPAKNIKKPRRAEVNYLPPHPQGETEGSLENERLNLFDEVNKRDNHQIITEKMAKTFSIRRQEIVNEAPAVSDLIGRWPALFDAAQINEEFKRISTINLEPTFMAKLDQYSPKIMALVSSKGGAAKINIQRIKNMLLEDDSVEMRREVAIRALIVFLKEKEEDLFKEDDGDITNDLMKIVIARSATPSSANIVIEGTEVLAYLNVPRACALLMGLIYSLNLSYPRELRHTFEVFQKIFLELDGLKASPRVMSLKNKLLC